MVYTVTLNPALDYIMNTEPLTVGTVNRSSGEHFRYGGKGINVSAVLTQLSIPNTALGFIGGFTGRQLETMLKADRIPCDFHYLKHEYTRINVKVQSNTETEINANGPIISESDMAALHLKIDNIKSGDFLVLAGTVPKSLPSDTYGKILERQSHKNINMIVDTTGDLLLNTLKYKPFLIKPNHIELGELFHTSVKNDHEIEYYAKKLQKLGARNVLVSQAENGAFLLDENGKTYHIKNADGKLVNSVGCGDSMVAGFIAGYIQTDDYSYALKLGTACGCASAFSNGLAEKEYIYKILNDLGE